LAGNGKITRKTAAITNWVRPNGKRYDDRPGIFLERTWLSIIFTKVMMIAVPREQIIQTKAG
jgi:hypothetical protein